LYSLGLNLEIVDGGDACLNRFTKNTSTNTNNYDFVIINTHLYDIPGLDIAKEIRRKNPKQRIVITTTSSKEHLAKEHLDLGIDHGDILTIPFRFSNLTSLLKLNRKKYSD
jgi:DNA-binding response OmpR family regulator